MHAHDHLQLIIDQASADVQDVIKEKKNENGHGNMEGSAGALS
jgi:hypothetical protein